MSKYVYIKYFSFARRGVLTGCRAGQADVRGGLAGGYGGIQERGAGPVPVADRLQDFARGGLGKGG